MTEAETIERVRQVLVLAHDLCPSRDDASELLMYAWAGVLADLPPVRALEYVEQLRTLLLSSGLLSSGTGGAS
jgi:hypothetical protein